MKKYGVALSLVLLLTSIAHGKVVQVDQRFFYEGNGERYPLILVNSLIEKGKIHQVKLYAGGNINLISFAQENEEEKLYSIDSKGFVYAIKPFTHYHVQSLTTDGFVQFAEEPQKNFKIDDRGLFIY